MKMNCNLIGTTVGVLAIVASASLAPAATIPVTDWVVHNSVSPVTVDNATTNSPSFTVADVATNNDIMSVMAPFPSISLANNGDYIKLTTTLTMANRLSTSTGTNFLNTQLHFGLFNGPAGAVAASDSPNNGFIAQYANSNQGHLKVFEHANANVDPFAGATQIGDVLSGNVVVDPENDAISGANPSAYFEMTLTRNGANIDITGQISGGNYLSTFSIPAYSSTTFPSGGPFTFNRVAFFLGNNVNAQDGSTFADVTVETNVPEPASSLLVIGFAVGGLLIGRRSLGASCRGAWARS